MTKKKSIQLSLRMDEDQHGRLVDVQEHISACSRGMKPDLMEIIRSVIGWGNPDLVTPEERAYLLDGYREFEAQKKVVDGGAL